MPPGELPSARTPTQGSAQWPDFSLLDANADGSLNRDEARANPALVTRWNEFDADRNGSLSVGEYIRARSLRNTPAASR
jgi:hypothetical protein